MENSIEPEVSPGAIVVHGVFTPSATTVCVTNVALWNATDSPARMLAGSGDATTQVPDEENAGESVMTTLGGAVVAVASVHASGINNASNISERFMINPT